MKNSKTNKIRIGSYSFGDRELSRVIFSKMRSKTFKSKHKFNKTDDRKHYKINF